MRRRKIAGLLALVVFLGAVPAAAQLAVAPNEPAPVLAGIDHRTFKPLTVDWSKSKVTVVNFWAEWCEPCKALMPRLQELYARRAADGLNVIGVHDPTLTVDEVKAFLRPLQVTYPILRQAQKIAADWGVMVLPTSYLIDDKGRIVRRYAGARAELADGLLCDAEALLDGRPLGTLQLVE